MNSRLIFAQSIVNTEYFNMVYSIFKDYCQGLPKENILNSKLVGITKNIRLTSMTLPCFNLYHDLFYCNNVKIIPKNISELLTAISLAFWIQDDGYFNKRDNTITLCTDSYLESEVDLLINALSSNFNIHCRKERKHKDGVQFRIVIRKSSLDHTRELVKSYFHDSMLYKLGL
jgi:hypothetical protein